MCSFVLAALKSTLGSRSNNSPAKRYLLSALLVLVAVLTGTGFTVAAGQSVRIVTTVAGLTRSVYGNGGPAAQAVINYSDAVAVDSAGNVYIADTFDNQIRKIDASTGVITAIAGTGQSGYSGDGQLAINAQLNLPGDLAVDAAGNVFIADTGNQVIRKVIAATGIISTIAGTPFTSGYSGDNGAATKAVLHDPTAVALDFAGNVYIADNGNYIIRKITDTTGIITTVAGTPGKGAYPGTGDGGPATTATLLQPEGVALDSGGNLYIADAGNCVVRRVAAATGIISTYAGDNTCGYSGDNGPASSAELGTSLGHVNLDASDNLYIPDYGNQVVRKVTASTGIITTIAGNHSFGFSGDGGPATDAMLDGPFGVAVAANGTLDITDYVNRRVRQISPAGIISTIAGNGSSGPVPNGVSATSAQLGIFGNAWPYSLCADNSGNFYFADTGNQVIRKVSASGLLSTIAGTGVEGYSGDGGPATSAELDNPASVVLDSHGNLYISDYGNNIVRKVDAVTGIISTYAGTYGQSSLTSFGGTISVSGDGGPATSAGVPNPIGLAFDGSGNLYIGEYLACVVRKVTTAGVISTYAGQANACDYPVGDGGPATSAHLAFNATNLAIDSQSNLYIGGNTSVRKVTAATGIITTIVGAIYSAGDFGDGGSAINASLTDVYGLAIDTGGNLYIADIDAVRMVNSSGIINTVVGQDNHSGYSGDGGLAASAWATPVGVAADNFGNIYFSDLTGSRIRKVSTASSTQPAAAAPTFDPAPGDFSSAPAVTITTTTPGAQIFYTLDGSTPNPGTSALYTGPVSLVTPVTLSAIAMLRDTQPAPPPRGCTQPGRARPPPL